MNLRTRLRKCLIKPPSKWKHFKLQHERYCVSVQTLFARRGLPWDIIQMELKSEGYLLPEEHLFEVLEDPCSIYRTSEDPSGKSIEDDTTLGDLPDDWSEEDDLKQEHINIDWHGV